MELVSIKHFICQLQGIHRSREYISHVDGLYCRTDVKDKKTLTTAKVLEIAREALQSLVDCDVCSKEKARLATNLAQGLDDLQKRVHTNFFIRLRRFACLPSDAEGKIAAQRAAALTAAAEYHAIEEPEPVVEPLEPFSKKFDTVVNFDSRHPILGIPVVETILQKISEDPLLHKVLTAWHKQAEHRARPVARAVAQCLDRGTCYGQSMKIFELLDSTERKDITPEYIHKNMVYEDYVRYQILHHLKVFVSNQSSKFFYGVDTKSAKEKLRLFFPHHAKAGRKSEWLKLAKLDRDMFIGRLSDFIRNDIRGRQSKVQKRDYAIKITLFGERSGHAAIIHYSETQNRFFWYDPYRKEYGMFTATHQGEFIKSVAAKILEYKDDVHFNRLSFTAYRI